eukprot:356952-Chlamydomonas_euryale.AAC.4
MRRSAQIGPSQSAAWWPLCGLRPGRARTFRKAAPDAAACGSVATSSTQTTGVESSELSTQQTGSKLTPAGCFDGASTPPATPLPQSAISALVWAFGKLPAPGAHDGCLACALEAAGRHAPDAPSTDADASFTLFVAEQLSSVSHQLDTYCRGRLNIGLWGRRGCCCAAAAHLVIRGKRGKLHTCLLPNLVGAAPPLLKAHAAGWWPAAREAAEHRGKLQGALPRPAFTASPPRGRIRARTSRIVAQRRATTHGVRHARGVGDMTQLSMLRLVASEPIDCSAALPVRRIGAGPWVRVRCGGGERADEANLKDSAAGDRASRRGRGRSGVRRATRCTRAARRDRGAAEREGRRDVTLAWGSCMGVDTPGCYWGGCMGIGARLPPELVGQVESDGTMRRPLPLARQRQGEGHADTLKRWEGHVLRTRTKKGARCPG